jgi:hypothetical protein
VCLSTINLTTLAAKKLTTPLNALISRSSSPNR